MEAKPIFLLCALFYAGYAGVIVRNNPIIINMKLIATADGKSFFADKAVARNWTEAKQVCADYGMTLAEISSKAQADALKAAYNPTVFDGQFWTSGRDIQKTQQFAWDTTGVVMSNDYPDFWLRTDLPYQTCVYYGSHWNVSAGSFYYCHHKLGTLCQT